jgi:hypothetical protein
VSYPSYPASSLRRRRSVGAEVRPLDPRAAGREAAVFQDPLALEHEREELLERAILVDASAPVDRERKEKRLGRHAQRALGVGLRLRRFEDARPPAQHLALRKRRSLGRGDAVPPPVLPRCIAHEETHDPVSRLEGGAGHETGFGLGLEREIHGVCGNFARACGEAQQNRPRLHEESPN